MAARSHAPHVVLLLAGLWSTAAFGQEPAQQLATSRTWPVALGIHAMVGAEPDERGTPVAFGVGGEVLWHGAVGAFAELLSSKGTPILVPAPAMGAQARGFADRISVPFGFAARPLAPIGNKRPGWVGAFLSGFGAQIGLSVEYLMTSDAHATKAGLHVGASMELPIWGGPMQGGITARFYARGVFTSETYLETTRSVYAPVAVGQFYGGLCYYP